MPIEITVVRLLRTLIEFAAFCMILEVLVHLVAFRTRERNPVYRVVRVVTQPLVRLTRAIAPPLIVDRHIPALTFLLLIAAWAVLGIIKQSL